MQQQGLIDPLNAIQFAIDFWKPLTTQHMVSYPPTSTSDFSDKVQEELAADLSSNKLYMQKLLSHV